MKRLLLIVFSTCLLVATAFVATTSCSSNEPQDETLQTEEFTTELTPEEQVLNANLAAYTTDFFAGREESRGLGGLFKKIIRKVLKFVAADINTFADTWSKELSWNASCDAAKTVDLVDKKNSFPDGLRVNFDIRGNQEVANEFRYCRSKILDNRASRWGVQGSIHNVELINHLNDAVLEPAVKAAINGYSSEIIPRATGNKISLEINATTTYNDIIRQYKDYNPKLIDEFEFIESFMNGLAKNESAEEAYTFSQGYLEIISESGLEYSRKDYLKGLVEFVMRSSSLWYAMIEEVPNLE